MSKCFFARSFLVNAFSAKNDMMVWIETNINMSVKNHAKMAYNYQSKKF